MKIKCDGKDGLLLGIQTNKGHVKAKALWKAYQWGLQYKAKSFTIERLTNTDYHGSLSDVETGYANMVVSYYSKVSEGEHSMNENYPISS